MKAILMIKFCVALSLTYIPGGVRTETITEVLNKMANKGEVIDGIFKPSKEGLMGFGLHVTTIYKGELFLLNNIKMDVAMKFSETAPGKEALKNEYEIYTYLNAINDSRVEVYGVPSIHYYGTWNNYAMMAMSLLNSPFRREIAVRRLYEEDLLIALREFLRAIKYIHSLGITNSDTDIENMMSANGRGFMFDFGESMGMTTSTREEYIKSTKEDFQRFLLSRLKGATIWDISKKFINGDEKNKGEKNSALKSVLDEFTDYAFFIGTDSFKQEEKTGTSFYDYLYRIINERLNNAGGEASSSNPSIPSMPYLFNTFLWRRPPVEYDFFEKMYSERIQDARKKN